MTADSPLSGPIRRIVEFYRSPAVSTARVGGLEIRERWTRTAEVLNAGCPAWPAETHRAGDVAGVPVDVTVFPAAGPGPHAGLLFVHGGAWVAGSTETHRQLCVRLAAQGLTVASVDYPLAPEHPFPAGLEGCHVALRWLRAEAAALGIDPARLAIAGDSAGANLAAAMLHDLVAGGGAMPFRAAVLAYGVFDFPATLRLPDGTPFVNGTTFSWQVDDYVAPNATEARLRDPRISPRYSPHLAGFPRSLLVVGEDDPLEAQSRDFAAALTTASMTAELRVYAGAPHAFLQIEELPACGEALAMIGRFLREALGA